MFDVRPRTSPHEAEGPESRPTRLSGSSSWLDHAACRGLNDVFFDAHMWDYAKRICDACPVRDECLADILTYEGSRNTAHRHGLVGGLTPTERNRIRRRAA